MTWYQHACEDLGVIQTVLADGCGKYERYGMK